MFLRVQLLLSRYVLDIIFNWLYCYELDSGDSSEHSLNFHGHAMNCKYTGLLLAVERPVVHHLV